MTTSHEALSRSQLQDAADEIPHWFHSIDLGQGIVTPGDKTIEILIEEQELLHLPDLRGKSVLDIGAWDGFYSWKAESLGASRVVSLDHFSWMIDRERAAELNEKWRKENLKPIPYEKTDAWKPDRLLGKRGYDLAHRALNSGADCVVADFLEVDNEDLGGPFDIVLFLGVLYHMRNPILALEKVAEATKDLAIIETASIELSNYPKLALCEFYERNEFGDDFTNWWAPNEKALIGMIRAAGFDRVEVIKGAPDRNPIPSTPSSFWTKLKRGGGDFLREFDLLPPLNDTPQPEVTAYRAVVHAWK